MNLSLHKIRAKLFLIKLIQRALVPCLFLKKLAPNQVLDFMTLLQVLEKVKSSKLEKKEKKRSEMTVLVQVFMSQI